MAVEVALLDLGVRNGKGRSMKEDFGGTCLALLNMPFCMIFRLAGTADLHRTAIVLSFRISPLISLPPRLTPEYVGGSASDSNSTSTSDLATKQ